MLYSVITTITQPTACVRELVNRLIKLKGRLIVAGDSKGPEKFEIENTEFLSIQDQKTLHFRLATLLPENHYARKNIGYLRAIERNADCIYETDDDNAPLPNWTLRSEYVSIVDLLTSNNSDTSKWVNIYKYFTQFNIWPRGLPLDEILSESQPLVRLNKGIKAPIQQGLVNNSPDVDAIWRLTMDMSIDFDNRASVYIEPGQWCPFNTQSTWWWPLAYALLYIPSFCSFRMCDIWKSFVAQRCLWELGIGIVFHAPEVYQDRNIHDLMKDFKDEIPGYTGNQKLVGILENLNLASGSENVTSNLLKCYEGLVQAAFFPEKELRLVQAWISDLESIAKKT